MKDAAANDSGRRVGGRRNAREEDGDGHIRGRETHSGGKEIREGRIRGNQAHSLKANKEGGVWEAVLPVHPHCGWGCGCVGVWVCGCVGVWVCGGGWWGGVAMEKLEEEAFVEPRHAGPGGRGGASAGGRGAF